MSGTIWVDPHVDYAGRSKTEFKDAWSPRKKLAWFLIFAAFAWSLVLTPVLLLG